MLSYNDLLKYASYSQESELPDAVIQAVQDFAYPVEVKYFEKHLLLKNTNNLLLIGDTCYYHEIKAGEINIIKLPEMPKVEEMKIDFHYEFTATEDLMDLCMKPKEPPTPNGTHRSIKGR